MAEVKWIKLSVNMFEDEKIRLIEALPEADTILIIWVKLLAQAGKTNASGYIYLNEHIPYTDEMLATIFNRPVGTVRLALKAFEQFGMIEINADHFISIRNWEKHQNIDGLEKIRLDTKKRVKRHREKQKQIESNVSCNVTVTHGNETEVEVEEEREKEITTTTTTENPIVVFEKLLCRLSPNQAEKLYQWIDDFNGQAEIVNEAIIIADNKNKRYFGFVEFLLKEWANNKLQTVDRVRVYEQEKFNKQKNIRTGSSKKSLFEQGEESKKRQATIKPLTPEEREELKRLEEDLPY
jgi:predicted phage replisome organizer